MVTKKRWTFNAVCRKLEAGNGSIKGMKMLYPVETALVEVQVIGISFNGHYGRHGVAIQIKPMHGAGFIICDATALVDDNERSRDLYFRRSEAAQFFRDNQPTNENEKNWQKAIICIRGNLDKARQDRFDSLVKTLIKDQQIKQLSKWEAEKALKMLIEVKYDLDLEHYEIEEA